MSKVLIIDDEEKLRALLARIIELEGFEVIQSSDLRNALKRLGHDMFDIVLCDVKLPDGSGVDFVKEIKSKQPFAEVILLTAFANIPDSVTAIKNGAFDYLSKGDDNNKIIPLLYSAIKKVELNKRLHQMEKRLDDKHSFDTVIGSSKKILEALNLARKVSPTDATVLLLGETGTGKEVFAQAIHQASSRKNQHFVALNCSAFSKELLESEMFGYRAGAFTGASKDKKGLFEEAHQGTIFLDELGEMPLDLQAKLLRVLESGEFLKIGETSPTKVDVRIIAATNRNLQEEIANGSFREDLFYRVSVFQIHLPSLNDRISDLPALVSYFVQIYANKMNKKIPDISKDYIEACTQHTWRGNIRELKNVVERSVILCNEVLTPEHLPSDFHNEERLRNVGKQLSAFDLASAEKIHIQKVLNYANGNKTKAAELLNIGLTTLYRKIAEYGLD